MDTSTLRHQAALRFAFIHRVVRRTSLPFVCAGALLCLVGLASPVAAVTYTWDPNGAAAGTGGSGAWDTTSLFWDNGLSMWPTTVADNDALFGGTAGTVTIIGGGVTANDLTFGVAGYTIAGGPLTLNGVSPTMSITVSGTAVITSSIGGSGGVIKTGDVNSPLYFDGNNSYSGTTAVNAGYLVVRSDGALGATGAGNNSTVASGATLQLEGGTVNFASENVSIAGFGVGGTRGARPTGAAPTPGAATSM